METQTYLYGDIWELVEVGGVVDGADLDGDGGGPLPDVVPVHVLEPGQALDLLPALHPAVAVVTKPAADGEDTTELSGVTFVLLPANGGNSCLRDRRNRRKLQCCLPVHNFPIGVLHLLRAEWRGAYQHLEHDDPQ